MNQLISFLGIGLFILIAWLVSENRKKVNFRIVLNGLLMQFVFALLILKTTPGRWFFEFIGRGFNKIVSFADAGAQFVFGGLLENYSFALSVLPTIIFFSSLLSVLYYFGIVQFFVRIFAILLVKILKTSGAESLSAATNIFVGQTESPLVVKPYIEKMTRSELMCIMTGGLATIAGGVLAAYIKMGVDSVHLIAASVMSAPAAIVFAKIIVPETETPLTTTAEGIKVEIADKNPIDAAARGASEGMQLAINVAAMLFAFIALIAMFNYFFNIVGTSLEGILGFVFRPIAFMMGVPWEESASVGTLLGQKTVLNEFIAYTELTKINQNAATALSPRSTIIATYALCGFSNFGSLAILIGGISAMAPGRRKDLASLSIRALIAGSLACLMTANIAGMLV